jgi:hypothetical protein
MGNQKEFIASVEKLKKEFEFACELAININADRLKHLETIERLQRRLSIYEKSLKDIAKQKTCAETEDDLEIPIGSDGSRLGDIEMGYDCCIEEARKSLAKANQKEDQQ